MKKLLLTLFTVLSITLLVACGTKTYEVKFDSNGGTPAYIESQVVDENKLVTEPTNVTKEGYELSNWFILGENTAWDFSEDTPTKDMTLVANWKEIEEEDKEDVYYSVSFDSNGGSIIDDLSVLVGNKVTKPANPTRANFEFVEWQLNGTAYNFDAAVNANIELKAVWKAIEEEEKEIFTVSFDLNGGTGTVSNQDVTEGEKVSKPTNPTKDNNLFFVWTLNGNPYDFDSAVSANITLVASWIEEETGGGEVITQTATIKGADRSDGDVSAGLINASLLTLTNTGSNNIKVSYIPGSSNNTPFNNDSSEMRLYVDSGFSIEIEGSLITSIKIETSRNNGLKVNDAESTDSEVVEQTFTEGVQSVKLQAAGNQVRISNITITYGGTSEGNTGLNDEQKVVVAKNTLTTEDLLGLNELSNEIKTHLSLPSTFEAVSVTWSSNNTAVIANNGVVNREDSNTNVTLTATFKSGSETETKTFNFTVLAEDDEPVDPNPNLENKIVAKMDFTDDSLSGSYSDKQASPGTIKNNVDNSNVSVITNRVNTSVPTGQESLALVLSSGTKHDQDNVSYVEFTFDETINKIILEAAYWSSYDQEEVTKAEVQEFINNAWVKVFDLKTVLELDYKNITIEDLNSTKIRIYAEGIAPGGDGNNGGRIIFNSIEVHQVSGIPLTDEERMALANNNLEIASLLGTNQNALEIMRNLNLPTNLNGVTISWASDNAAINSNGSVVRPEDDTNVKLTATLSIGSLTETKVFEFIVLKKSETTNPGENDPEVIAYYSFLEGYTAGTLQWKTALENKIKNQGRNGGSTSQVKQVDVWGGSYYLIYSGQGPYNNREHVVPASYLRATSGIEDDLHNLRAANEGVNSSRGNMGFTDGSGSYKNIGGRWYPGDEHKGDVARIVMYIATRHGVPFEQKVGNHGPLGDLSMFLRWHEEDPVSEFEITRNNRIYDLNDNRNPFIDFPEYADLFFGTTVQTNMTVLEELITFINHDLVNNLVFEQQYVDLNRNEYLEI